MAKKKNARSASAPVSTGRPTREQQAQRDEELLNVALDVFLERGFDQTTMEEIATTVGMSKRTVYARYADKSALFQAAVRRAIERYTVPHAAVQALVSDDLEETLLAIARQRIFNIAAPVAIKLQRILTAQSYRFPDLFYATVEQGTGPTIEVLVDVFARHRASGEIEQSEPHETAMSFLSLAVGGSARLIIAGQQLQQSDIEQRIKFAVRLFLNGLRRRSPSVAVPAKRTRAAKH